MALFIIKHLNGFIFTPKVQNEHNRSQDHSGTGPCLSSQSHLFILYFLSLHFQVILNLEFFLNQHSLLSTDLSQQTRLAGMFFHPMLLTLCFTLQLLAALVASVQARLPPESSSWATNNWVGCHPSSYFYSALRLLQSWHSPQQVLIICLHCCIASHTGRFTRQDLLYTQCMTWCLVWNKPSMHICWIGLLN